MKTAPTHTKLTMMESACKVGKILEGSRAIENAMMLHQLHHQRLFRDHRLHDIRAIETIHAITAEDAGLHA